jgi:hypothetical protein
MRDDADQRDTVCNLEVDVILVGTVEFQSHGFRPNRLALA